MSGPPISASGSLHQALPCTLPLLTQSFSSPSAKWEYTGALHSVVWGRPRRECLQGGGDRQGCVQGVGEGYQSAQGKVRVKWKKLFLGALSSPVPSKNWGEGKRAQRDLRPSPNLVIRPFCVVFLLQKMLIYCNLKNDRARAGDSAAGTREREISFCSAGNWAAAPTPTLLSHPSPGMSNVECRQAPPRSCLPSSGAEPAGIYQKPGSF